MATTQYQACSNNPYIDSEDTLMMAQSALPGGEREARLAPAH